MTFVSFGVRVSRERGGVKVDAREKEGGRVKLIKFQIKHFTFPLINQHHHSFLRTAFALFCLNNIQVNFVTSDKH